MPFVLAFCLSASAPCSAIDPWTTQGPWGGRVNAFLELPGGDLLAGGEGGLYRSQDGALTWSAVPGFNRWQRVTGLARSASGSLLASTGDGLYRSDDGGTAWALIAGTQSTSSLATDPVDGRTWCAALGYYGFGCTADDGLSWNRTWFGSESRGVAAAGGGVFLGGDGSGMHRTTDSGSTWSAANEGLASMQVDSFAADPVTAFVATDEGLYASTDKGSTWAKRLSGSGLHVLAAVGGRVWIFAGSGCWRSEDGGLNWASLGSTSSIVNALLPIAGSSSLLAAEYRNVLKSTDAGVTWAPRSQGIGAVSVQDIAVSRLGRTIVATGATLFAQSADGVWRSGDLWSSWGVTERKDGSFTVALDAGLGSVAADGSTMGFLNPGNTLGLWGIAADAVDPQALYGYYFTVFRSINGGATWSPSSTAPDGMPSAITVSPREGGVVWVAGFQGLARSTDGGDHFDAVTDGLPAGGNLWSDTLAWDAQGRLYTVIGGNAIYRNDDGMRWTRVPISTSSCASPPNFVVAHPWRVLTLYGSSSCGVLRSTDGGTTWSDFGLGTGATKLAVGANGTLLVANVSRHGVWSRSLVDPSAFYTLAPCRAVDTRDPAAPLAGPALAAASTRTFALAGTCGIPADAKSLAVNVTVVYPAAAGDLRLFPGDEIAPLASTINFRAGQVRANNANLGVSQDGTASVTVQADMAFGTVDFLLDVVGFYR